MKNTIQDIRERQMLRRKAMDSRKLVIFRKDGLPVVVSEDGGPGSGNFGHGGRPGKVVGSSGGEGSKSASAPSSKAPKAKTYNNEIMRYGCTYRLEIHLKRKLLHQNRRRYIRVYNRFVSE